jgi:peptidylprolyl isomerase
VTKQLLFLVLLVLLAAACGPAVDDNTITTESGLQVEILEEGTGEIPEAGDLVSVHYRGTLEDGTPFDNSYDRGQPYTFPLGMGRVIAGWDEGIALLNEGTTARLTIPAELGYGEAGSGEAIPPGATLVFEVELIEVIEGPPDAPQAVDPADYTTTESGLQYYDFEVGAGASPQPGQPVSVHYTGWLEDGQMFDSSLVNGRPIQFPVGQGNVIPGWDEGLLSMNFGGRRQLRIPPELAYGEEGYPGVIPPNSTLIFEVELLDAQ